VDISRAEALSAIAAGAIAIAVGALYVSIISSQGPREYCSLCEPGVWLIAGYMFGGGILATASALIQNGRTYALAAAAGILTFIALIVLVSSIALFAGLPMLLAAGLTVRASAQASKLEGTSKATTLAVALLTFVAGVGGEFATIALRGS
jgi:hypothetical protein